MGQRTVAYKVLVRVQRERHQFEDLAVEERSNRMKSG